MDYDLVIIGAGPAGFSAALEAKKAGLKVALIEKDKVGGTCLNRGCIPTKSLVYSAKIYNLAKKAANFGIVLSEPKLDFLQIQNRKEKIVQQLRSGMEFMLKGIDMISGEARILSADTVLAAGKEIIAKSILIAVGSKPAEIKALQFDAKKIISSDHLLNLRELPKSLLIIGGGAIGCEFAGIFSSFGVKVTLIEKMPQLLPGIDAEVARKLEAGFKKKGIKVNTASDAQAVNLADFDLVLVCVGRSPNTENLGLEELGIKLGNKRILTDEYLKTNISGIYAAGDSSAKLCLAHYASYQGEIAAHNILNPANQRKCDNAVVPNCIFTDPQIACVGMDEQAVIAKGYEIEINKFDFLSSGAARIFDESEGFVKIVSDAKTGIVLGSAMIGPQVTELISVLTVAIFNKLTVSSLRQTIFAHPTLSEAVRDAL